MDILQIIHATLIATLSLRIPVLRAAFPADCDYVQNFVLGQKYYIYSPGYPEKYRPLTSCFWYGVSPPGTNIILTCEEIDLPSTSNCRGDKLKISLTGNKNMVDSQNYCGRGILSLASTKNQIAIELSTTILSTGGRFICTLTAIESFDYEENESNVSGVPTACDCGLKSSIRIVGGVATKVNEFPSMAGLINAPDPSVVCGANIISERYVLSAAHCIAVLPIETLGILVGDWNISSGLDTSAAALYKAEAFQVHPKFDPIKQINDIAVVKTQTKIIFSLRVNPICLPFRFSTDSFKGENVTLLGWGQLFFSGPLSEVLQKVNVDVIDNEECQRKLTTNTITKSQLCTFKQGKDACQSDSGGPVLWEDPISDRFYQIGVVSFGYACATSRPGVHTRVTSYLAWIISATRDAKYCIK